MKATLNTETMNQEILITLDPKDQMQSVSRACSKFFQQESERMERDEEMMVVEEVSPISWKIIGCYGEDVEDYAAKVVELIKEF